MKLSCYNVVLDHKDGHVIYNMISGSLLLLDKEAYYIYLNYNKIDHNNETIKLLKDNKFLIEDDFDEIYYMEKRYDLNTNKPYDKELTIVVTDKCNLGCFYCYEDKQQWKNMSNDVINQTKIFVEKFINCSPTNSLHVVWFGGEPTLNLSCVEELSSCFKKICDQQKILFTQSMVTNGTNINEKISNQLLSLGIKQLQITIDGYKEDHDASRPYLTDLSIEEMSEIQIEQRKKINPKFGMFLNIIGQEPIIKKKKSSYQKILNNLLILHENGFNVSLRCNIHSGNLENHHKLLEELDCMRLTSPHKSGGLITPYLALVFNHNTNDQLRDITKEKFAYLTAEVQKKYHGNTSSTTRINHFSATSCTANKQFSFCISQSGTITKCWRHASNEEHPIGTVFDIHLAETGFKDEWSPFKDEECLGCKVLPLCLGGCKSANLWYKSKYNSKNYEGCSDFRWNHRKKISDLYESLIAE